MAKVEPQTGFLNVAETGVPRIELRQAPPGYRVGEHIRLSQGIIQLCQGSAGSSHFNIVLPNFGPISET